MLDVLGVGYITSRVRSLVGQAFWKSLKTVIPVAGIHAALGKYYFTVFHFNLKINFISSLMASIKQFFLL